MHSVLPWDWYRDPRVLAVEERRLFRPSWQYVGPLECLQQPGDQMVGRLLRVPVVVVRDGDGELRGFLNVCRHRGSLVVPAGVAGSWIDRGRILPQERLLADFQRYVYAACAGEVAPG
jgi:phenylpropionate dioxygenase-like ring-hydroxylating dioxygenase large terminal subunit